MLGQCSSCDGFVPGDHLVCPHCDRPLGRRPVVQAFVSGAMWMTLMACYGASSYEPYEPPAIDEQDWQAACEASVALDPTGAGVASLGATDVLRGSCVGGGGPEAVMRYEPIEHAGEAGTLRVYWKASHDPVGVYVMQSCASHEQLACASARLEGKLKLEVPSLGPLDVVVDGAGYSEDNTVKIQVTFDATDPG